MGVVRVRDAGAAPPTIPFWMGEAPARTAELSAEVSAVRTAVDGFLAAGDPDGARAVVARGRGHRRRRRHHGRRLPGGRARGARGDAHPGTARVRALLRRDRRHAARRALPLRRTGQPLARTRAAQEVLPHLQLRAAGRGERRRHRAVARPAPQLPAAGGARLPQQRDGRRHARARDPRLPHVPGPVALEPQPLAHGPALPQRAAQPAAHPAHGVRRPHGRGVPAGGRVPGERHRPDRDPRPRARAPDRRRHAARGTRRRRHARAARAHRGGRGHRALRRHHRAVGARARDPHRAALRVPRRRGAPEPPHQRGHVAARASRSTSPRSARSIPTRSSRCTARSPRTRRRPTTSHDLLVVARRRAPAARVAGVVRRARGAWARVGARAPW